MFNREDFEAAFEQARTFVDVIRAPVSSMSAAATRRSLFAATTAAIIGSGIVAGVAASAVDLVSAEPDAALLALCAEFTASEAAFCAIYDNPDSSADDVICDALAAPILNSWPGMLDRMATFRASTPEGLAARAIVLARHSGLKPGTDSYPFAFDPEDGTVSGRLLHYLLRDATAIGGAAY